MAFVLGPRHLPREQGGPLAMPCVPHLLLMVSLAVSEPPELSLRTIHASERGTLVLDCAAAPSPIGAFSDVVIMNGDGRPTIMLFSNDGVVTRDLDTLSDTKITMFDKAVLTKPDRPGGWIARDIDGDDWPEALASLSSRKTFMVMNTKTGERQWEFAAPPNERLGPIIPVRQRDGTTSIVFGNTASSVALVDHTGEQIGTQSWANSRGVAYAENICTTFDFDHDGAEEIVVSNQGSLDIRSSDGKLIRTTIPDSRSHWIQWMARVNRTFTSDYPLLVQATISSESIFREDSTICYLFDMKRVGDSWEPKWMEVSAPAQLRLAKAVSYGVVLEPANSKPLIVCGSLKRHSRDELVLEVLDDSGFLIASYALTVPKRPSEGGTRMIPLPSIGPTSFLIMWGPYVARCSWKASGMDVSAP